jgi:hypothetical protein
MPNMRFRRHPQFIATRKSWLYRQLRGDVAVAKSFVGEDCGLCDDPR